eukprot:CAMPEP_0184546534 /NCGR_PEP_ID=MMETSP0199_2-20130426/5006_1 /TAXON_ID=1112570 /ORGANISM="Thraustochytrium sp., Strain LLF1b" /LENGTH=488 /DNA_ID=CAMNT_0026940947 /DNA_START=171 /DNA_END=1633 /DNA_ORIENTATION=+
MDLEHTAMLKFEETDLYRYSKIGAVVVTVVAVAVMTLFVCAGIVLTTRVIEGWEVRRKYGESVARRRPESLHGGRGIIVYSMWVAMICLPSLAMAALIVANSVNRPFDWIPSRVEVAIQPDVPLDPSVVCLQREDNSTTATCATFWLGKAGEDTFLCDAMSSLGATAMCIGTVTLFLILSARASLVLSSLFNTGDAIVLNAAVIFTKWGTRLLPVGFIFVIVFWVTSPIIPGGLCVQIVYTPVTWLILIGQLFLGVAYLYMFLFPFKALSLSNSSATESGLSCFCFSMRHIPNDRLRHAALRNLRLSSVALATSTFNVAGNALLDIFSGGSPTGTIELPQGTLSSETVNALVDASRDKYQNQYARQFFLFVPLTDQLINFVVIALISSAWKPTWWKRMMNSSRLTEVSRLFRVNSRRRNSSLYTSSTSRILEEAGPTEHMNDNIARQGGQQMVRTLSGMEGDQVGMRPNAESKHASPFHEGVNIELQT